MEEVEAGEALPAAAAEEGPGVLESAVDLEAEAADPAP